MRGRGGVYSINKDGAGEEGYGVVPSCSGVMLGAGVPIQGAFVRESGDRIRRAGWGFECGQRW